MKIIIEQTNEIEINEEKGNTYCGVKAVEIGMQLRKKGITKTAEIVHFINHLNIAYYLKY
jgi:hypothetical protein